MADWNGPSSFLRFYYRPSFTDDFALKKDCESLPRPLN